MPDKPIYLDYNATTPIDHEVADAMLPYLYEHFGNPSSAHPYGRAAREAVDRARDQVAALLNASPGEVVFTSGGTEANNMVIKGVAEAAGRGHIVTSAVEHPAVLEPCRWLAARGFEITVVGVDAKGRVDPGEVQAALRGDTILVSIMLANNEVGTIQPVAEIARLAHERGALMHTDAAQAVGKIPVDVQALGVDFLSVAGHKLYAPKGVGALYLRQGVELPKFMHGAAHERNRRAGTENVAQIAGLGMAAEIARRDMASGVAALRETRDRLYGALTARLDDIRRNGDPDNCLPNTLSLSFKGVQANVLVERISSQVAASAGAACHADQVTVSTVLAAMDVPTEYAMGTLRLSTGRMTTTGEVDAAAAFIAEAVEALRAAKQEIWHDPA
ncbi:MAG TPA: cysteine desulfurase family protein [Aggregatilineales bacterium]|nr:cysteine desulfurase family protein [Aggregatilineales bacterium]